MAVVNGRILVGGYDGTYHVLTGDDSYKLALIAQAVDSAMDMALSKSTYPCSMNLDYLTTDQLNTLAFKVATRIQKDYSTVTIKALVKQRLDQLCGDGWLLKEVADKRLADFDKNEEELRFGLNLWALAIIEGFDKKHKQLIQNGLDLI